MSSCQYMILVLGPSFTWSEGEGTEAPCELSRVAWDSGRCQRSGYSPGTQNFAQQAGAWLAELAEQPAWHSAQQLAIQLTDKSCSVAHPCSHSRPVLMADAGHDQVQS